MQNRPPPLARVLAVFAATFALFASAARADDARDIAGALRATLAWPSPLLGGDIEARVHHRAPPAPGQPAPLGILYLKNTGAPRTGTEPDDAIVADYIRRGYTVVTLDYRGDSRAVSPALEKEIFSFYRPRVNNRQDRRLDERLFVGAETCRPSRAWILPSGYRVSHDQPYYDIARHGPFGITEKMVRDWNEKIAPNVPGAKPARTFADLKMKDGSSPRTTYVMDVIYPSRPAAPVPILVRFCTDIPKDPNCGDLRWHFLGFTLRGGAYAAVEHCHDPLYFDYASQLGNDNYSLVKWLGLGSGQAALRQLHARAAEFGIDPGRFLGHGLSKGQYFVTRMLNPAHERQTESARLEGFPEGSPEPQPYAGHPARLAAGYQSAGWGNFFHSRTDAAGNPVLTPDYLPTLIAIGENDTPGVVAAYHQFVKKLGDLGVKNHRALFMPGVGHELPQGWNPEQQRDNYDIYVEFFAPYLAGGKKESEVRIKPPAA